jgi:polygalacturonase
MRCPDAIIKGNRFENLAGPAVVIANDSGFLQEGPSGDNTLVEDNTFTNIERSNIMLYSGAGEQSDKATEGVINVIIRNNRFDSYGGPNIYGRGVVGNVFTINNADNVLIENNTVGKVSSPEFAAEPIIMSNAGKVTWKNNTIDGKPLNP